MSQVWEEGIFHWSDLKLPPLVDASKSDRIITVSKDKTVKSWYTPEAIMQWLKTAPIPKLSKEEKENLGIADFEID